MKGSQNVTVSLPETLLRRFRVYAAERNKSMTEIMTQAIEALMDEDDRRAASKRRFLARLASPPGRGTNGRVSWSREDLHER